MDLKNAEKCRKPQQTETEFGYKNKNNKVKNNKDNKGSR